MGFKSHNCSMRILQIINQLSSFMGDSGQVLMIAKILQQLGHEVTIVTTDGDPFVNNPEHSKMYAETRKKLLCSKGQLVYIDGIPVYAAHCISTRLGMYSPNATKIAKKIVKNFDIVHIYSWYYHLAFVFYKISYQHKKPLFVSLWGTLQPESHNFHKRKKEILDFFYTKKMINRATGLHSIGKSETFEYIKWRAQKNKIYEIDNGIVPENFKLKDPTHIFDRIGISRKQPFLLFLGRVHKKKGIELLLKAFKLLLENQSIILVIAGSGEATYIQKLKDLTNQLKIEESVKFTGAVNESEKLDLLSAARIFVLTSINDIHPRSVQEALTVGVPVLITKTCDYPEIAEYNAGRLIDYDVSSIYRNLLEMLENEIELKMNSINGKKLINEKFLEIDQVKKFEAIYQSVLEK